MWSQIQFVSERIAEKDNKVQEGIWNETSLEKVTECLKPFVEMVDKDEVENNKHLERIGYVF